MAIPWGWAIAVALFLFLLAALERSIREIARTVIQAPAQAIALLHDVCRRAAGTTLLQCRSAFRALTEGASWPGWPIIGTVIYFAIFFLALASDLGILLLTLEAMGLIRISAYLRRVQGLLDLGLLTVLALLASAAFFGLLFLDLLGITPFGVLWNRTPRWFQRILRGIAIVGALIVLFLFMCAGLWRALRVIPPELLRWMGPRAFFLEGLTQLLLFVGIPLLTIATTFLSGWSLGWVAGLLWGLFLFALTIPTGLASVALFLTFQILGHLSAALDALLRSLAGAGRWLAHLVGSPVRLALRLLVGGWNWLVSFEWISRHLHLGPADPGLPDRFDAWWEALFSGLWAREPEEEAIIPPEEERSLAPAPDSDSGFLKMPPGG